MKRIKDPRFIGVPNINFSLTDPDDDREKIYKKQRKERGFDDSELWSLDCTIANFIIPRLEKFYEISDEVSIKCYPPQKRFLKQIDCILVAMKLITRDNGARNFTDDEQERVQKGLKTLSKIFLGLWW